MNKQDLLIGTLKAIAMTAKETAVMERNLQEVMATDSVTEHAMDCPTCMNEQALIGTLRDIRMTAAETEHMYAAFPLPVPEQSSFLLGLGSFLRPTAVLAFVLIASVGMATVSYAAQSALPGDVLYPVKIHFNEAIRQTLIRSPEGKALNEVERAEERLKEAEALDALGRLSPGRSELLMRTFHERIRQAQEFMYATAPTGSGAQSVVRAEINRTLRGHAPILKILEERAPMPAETEPAGKPEERRGPAPQEESRLSPPPHVASPATASGKDKRNEPPSPERRGNGGRRAGS